MKLVLLGIQGSGKSTQGSLLSSSFTIPYISTGNIFREIAKEKTKLGREIKEVMNAGFLIPDEKTIEVVNDYLKRSEYADGYIIDGFPRTLVQAEAFVDGADKVIYLELSDKEALRRISKRNDMRDDETPDAIKKRIESFHKFTKPVLKYYEKKNQLIRVDGSEAVEKIFDQIKQRLESKRSL